MCVRSRACVRACACACVCVCVSVCLSVGRSVGRSVGLSVGRSVGLSVGLSVGRSVCRSVCHSVHPQQQKTVTRQIYCLIFQSGKCHLTLMAYYCTYDSTVTVICRFCRVVIA